MSDANSKQAEYWEDLASTWLAASDHHERIAAPFGNAAMAALGEITGHQVLDIGCGSGGTTIELARMVGSTGEAVGVDIAPAMVAAARRLAGGLGLENVRFLHADAQVSQIAEGRFDDAFSRFGVMFFDDPGSAFRNIRAMLKPGGQLAFSCWQNIFANEWMFIPGSAVIAVTGSLPPMPAEGQPGPFSLSDPTLIRAVLSDAGFTDVEVTPLNQVLVAPAAGVDSMVELSQRVGPVRETLLDADPETATKVLAAVRSALEAKVIDGELRLAAAAHIVTARA
ncbi:MAG: methyltransferase domain-containing protein [Ilumatobacteraceae bacterium]